MTPDQLAEAIASAMEDPDFYGHLEGGLPGMRSSKWQGNNTVLVECETGQRFTVQVWRTPKPQYL